MCVRCVLTELVSKRCFEKAAFYGKTVSTDMSCNCPNLLLCRSYKAAKNAVATFIRFLHNKEDLSI
jgi:hypothetical protein